MYDVRNPKMRAAFVAVSPQAITLGSIKHCIVLDIFGSRLCILICDRVSFEMQDALHGMASGAIDGVFIDRANWCEACTDGRGWDNETCASMVPAQRLLLGELTEALGEGNITLAKEHGGTGFIDWQVVNAAMTSDAFCSAYCHGCNDSVTPAMNGWR